MPLSWFTIQWKLISNTNFCDFRINCSRMSETTSRHMWRSIMTVRSSRQTWRRWESRYLLVFLVFLSGVNAWGVLFFGHCQATQDKADNQEGVVEIPESDDKDEVCAAVAANVLWQMDNDRKTTALKQLQGHMWREAYKTGAVQGEWVIFNVNLRSCQSVSCDCLYPWLAALSSISGKIIAQFPFPQELLSVVFWIKNDQPHSILIPSFTDLCHHFQVLNLFSCLTEYMKMWYPAFRTG